MSVQRGDRYQDQRFEQVDGSILEFTNNRWIDISHGTSYNIRVTQFILANYTYLGNFSKSTNFSNLFDILNEK